MATLGVLSPWRHVVVGGAVATIGLATLTGVIGEERSERFDSKQVVVAPAGDDGLRVREVVDFDFGDHQRHGYERIIPNDFGVPTEVTADSPTAPDDVSVERIGSDTRIRIGDPDLTVSGQHRYTLQYTYPATTVSSGFIGLDIIDTDETLRTSRFEIVVTGFELTNLRCNVGARGAEGGCEFVADGDVYRAVIEPLEPGDGITIGAEITGRREVVAIEPPPLPEPNPNYRAPLAAGTVLLGAAAGGGMYAWARRRGRNEVFGGGAADAAYGGTGPVSPRRPDSGTPLPPPPTGDPEQRAAPSGTRLVADERMDELATIEFVPPGGVEPWLGNVLLGERIGNDTVAAWISGAAARDFLSITKTDGEVVVRAGSRFSQAPADEQQIMTTMLGSDDSITLGKYSKSFSKAWAEIRRRQASIIDRSGYWKRPLSRSGGTAAGIGLVGFYALIIGGFLLFRGAAKGVGLLDHPVAALAIAVGVPAVLAFVFYNSLLPARTAVGSALTLRTESFRRFLAASEGQHVDWAWKHGLIREYSAWAVALGAADAWERAMQASNVPPAEYSTGPMMLYYSAAVFSSTHTAPSSSGGGAGGSFSGGSVGGGGGGGSSGSW